MPEEKETELRRELARLINRYSVERGSNTPDFILADYLVDCLKTFDKTVMAREKWYGREKEPIGGEVQRAHPPKSAVFEKWVVEVTGHELHELPTKFHGYLHTAFAQGVSVADAREGHAAQTQRVRSGESP